jgi:hypothetical protein
VIANLDHFSDLRFHRGQLVQLQQKLIALPSEPVDGFLEFGVVVNMTLLEIFKLLLPVVGEGLAFAELHGKLGDSGQLGFVADLDGLADVLNLAGTFADELGQAVLVLAKLDNEMPVLFALGGVLPTKFAKLGLLSFESTLKDIVLALQVVELRQQAGLFEHQLIPLGGEPLDLIVAEALETMEASGPAEFILFPGGNIYNGGRQAGRVVGLAEDFDGVAEVANGAIVAGDTMIDDQRGLILRRRLQELL